MERRTHFFLKKITSFIHEHNSIAGIQLAHAGRKASVSSPWQGNKLLSEDEGGWKPAAPSAVPFKESDPAPHELTKEEIASLVDAFKQGARRAREAGFKVVEIHGAHGYLINEFLSPASNFRTDEYGGSFENRIRFLLEIIEAVKTEWPEELPLFVRVSASDWSEKGWTADDSVKLATIIKNKGVDLMDCSSGGNVYKAPIKVEPLYQVQFAEKG